MNNGIIFNIEKSFNKEKSKDRFTIFLKGCPLNCLWCHYPESLSLNPEIIYRSERCIDCGDCQEECNNNAIVNKNGSLITIREKCTLCESCIESCPSKAREIIGKKKSMSEIIKDIGNSKFAKFGTDLQVMFSGGEPLAQPDFLSSLLQSCKEKKYTTIVDTCGMSPTKILLDISKYVDIFLYDIKIINDDLHQKYTGVSNKLLLNNLKELVNYHNKIIIMIPIIPGINDDDDNINLTGELLKSLKLWHINLLPFKKASSDKYKKLGKNDDSFETQIPSDFDLIRISERLKKFNLNITIGEFQ